MSTRLYESGDFRGVSPDLSAYDTIKAVVHRLDFEEVIIVNDFQTKPGVDRTSVWMLFGMLVLGCAFGYAGYHASGLARWFYALVATFVFVSSSVILRDWSTRNVHKS